MPRLIFFFCLIFFAASVAISQIEFDVRKPLTTEQAGLKGQVHTCKVYEQTMTIVDGNASLSVLRPLVETVYEQAGRMIEARFYNHNGQLQRANSYQYSDGFLQKSHADFYDKDAQLYRKTEYDYDNVGEIKLQINFDYDDNGKMFRKTVLTRDENGLLNVKDLKADGSPFKRNFLDTPQSNSNKAKEAKPKEKKILALKRRMVYDEVDEYGNWTKRTVFGGVDASSGNKVETREITDRIITYYQTKN